MHIKQHGDKTKRKDMKQDIEYLDQCTFCPECEELLELPTYAKCWTSCNRDAVKDFHYLLCFNCGYYRDERTVWDSRFPEDNLEILSEEIKEKKKKMSEEEYKEWRWTEWNRNADLFFKLCHTAPWLSKEEVKRLRKENKSIYLKRQNIKTEW